MRCGRHGAQIPVPGSQGKKARLPYRVLVGTHHKTGSRWMARIFRTTARKLGLAFVPHIGTDAFMPPEFDIFYHCHSGFRLNDIDAEYRGVHLIRDPRDTIVSGCFYHQKSREPWLHRKRMKFGGMTYQEKINSYATFSDKLLFELEHSARSRIGQMSSWDYGNPRFFEAKYEDLIRDSKLVLFETIFRFLGFPDKCMLNLKAIAYGNSLFSQRLRPGGHIRSGVPDQWQQYFEPVHRTRFAELYGDVLIKLGYEVDDGWVGDFKIPPAGG